jgi:hypothetical protein
MTGHQEAAREGLAERFLGRLGLRPGQGVDILETPTEEIIESLGRGRAPSIFSMAKRKKKRLVRKEENYLYSTRRFPLNNANNTIGSGAVAQGDYDFFGNGVGDGGGAMGYFSLANLTYLQTNMDKGGKIPTGRGFALFELAVSFNADALGTDISQCLDTMELRYEKQGGQLVIHHGPIRNWPGGVGLSGYAATAVGGSPLTISASTNGVPNLAAVRRFKQPRLLNANESFKYTLNATANLPKNNAAVALLGFVEICIWLFGFHYDRIPQ